MAAALPAPPAPPAPLRTTPWQHAEAGGGAVRWREVEAPMRTPIRISRRVITSVPLVHVAFERDGVVGHGEAPPNSYYGETTGTVLAVLPLLAGALEDPWDWQGLERRGRTLLRQGHPSVRSALESAVLDWCARSVGLPVWRLLGLAPGTARASTMTIGVGTPEETAAAAQRAVDAGWGHLKLKLGGRDVADDAAALRAVRLASPGTPLGVDVNAGWSRTDAVGMLGLLAELGVDVLEQPLAADDLDGLADLTRRSSVPVVLDESVRGAADVGRVAHACHGVNLKVSKCGGLLESLRALDRIRERGLLAMVGCMAESSLGIAPAATLAPAVDVVDLYGSQALGVDPATGLRWDGPVVRRGDGPGWGVVPLG